MICLFGELDMYNKKKERTENWIFRSFFLFVTLLASIQIKIMLFSLL